MVRHARGDGKNLLQLSRIRPGSAIAAGFTERRFCNSLTSRGSWEFQTSASTGRHFHVCRCCRVSLKQTWGEYNIRVGRAAERFPAGSQNADCPRGQIHPVPAPLRTDVPEHPAVLLRLRVHAALVVAARRPLCLRAWASPVRRVRNRRPRSRSSFRLSSRSRCCRRRDRIRLPRWSCSTDRARWRRHSAPRGCPRSVWRGKRWPERCSACRHRCAPASRRSVIAGAIAATSKSFARPSRSMSPGSRRPLRRSRRAAAVRSRRRCGWPRARSPRAIRSGR